MDVICTFCHPLAMPHPATPARHRRHVPDSHDLGLRLGGPLGYCVFVGCVYGGGRLFVHAPKNASIIALVAAAAVLLLAALVLGIVVHELGHALAVRLLGQRVSALHLGSPPARATIRLGTTPVFLGWKLRGHVEYPGHRMTAGRRAAVLAAGPAADLASAPCYLLLPLPHWQAALLVVVTVAGGLKTLIPERDSDGELSDGAKLLQTRARLRAQADIRRLLDASDWVSQPDAADRLLNGFRLDVPAAEDCIRELVTRPGELLRLHAQDWTLPDAPEAELANGVHHLCWKVLALPGPPVAAVDLAATRVEWVLRHVDGQQAADERRPERDVRIERANARHTLAVARLRQGWPDEVEPLCAEVLGIDLKPGIRATVLATVAMARHALGQPAWEPLAEALALDPDADLVGEAASRLDGQPVVAP
jgi:hypothetical protein